MLFTWVPQFGPHILRQYAKGWAYFLGMGVMFWYLPNIVHHLIGKPTTPVSAQIFQHYTIFVGFAFFTSFFASEFIALKLKKYRPRSLNDVLLIANIATMAERAGLREPPELVVLDTDRKRMNAMALSTVFGKAYVFAAGDIKDVLTRRQRDAVFAHEVAHIKHRDNLAFAVIHAGSTALKMQLYVILIGVFVGIVTLPFTGAVEFAYAAKVFLITGFIMIVYDGFSAAFSRTREFLADMGAMAILDLDHRDELIAGMATVGYHISGRRPIELMQRTGLRIFQSHPSFADRADALGVSVSESRGQAVFHESKV